MVLFSRDLPDIPEPAQREYVQRWRKSLTFELYEGFGGGIGWVTEYLSTHTGQWTQGKTDYIYLNITKHFALGSDHGYYDGPHCSFSIGWLHLCWSLGWCEKCMPSENCT